MRKTYRAIAIALALGLVAVTLCACSDAVAPKDELTRRIETQTYTYHLSPNDWVATTWQDVWQQWRNSL